eukprot:CAMPEP_0115683874 /NCGR_PEP_ID=MMETSP0272-20121206/58626_1 /TAXON_ID=71861 /ORGANISM="Scrippsiella trochoidea, Strain CCMP3099" /LENGTH=37 /DNA_ID= /DNA_START= /DNA_END= /DNA_ORIENTATION=
MIRDSSAVKLGPMSDIAPNVFKRPSIALMEGCEGPCP